MKKLLLLFSLIFATALLSAQTYTMDNTSETTCSGTFYDSGGSGANYSSSESFTKTFSPGTAGAMLQFNFTMFDCESITFDHLEIYDGPNTGSPLIGSYGGSTGPGLVTATNTGDLTFVWTSDGSVTYPGWEAEISCLITYTMANSTVTTCSGQFMDPQGTAGYNDFNGSMTMTFNSGSTDHLQFDFTVFDTRENNDNLRIYDGPNTGSPLIGTYANTTSPGTVISSGTSLTFVWTTDNNQDGDPGWEADITCVPDMAFASSTVTQASTADVYPNDVEREIICVEVVTTGAANPIDVTSFIFRTNGSSNPTNDIQNAKVWYTGTSNTFATGTQFGATVANPPAINTNMTINGSQTLAEGTNYFWLTYDIRPGAAGGNDVDGCCYRVNVDGTLETPTTTCPAGVRPIIVPPANDDPCGAQLLSVNSGSCAYTTGTNLNATNSVGITAPGCSSLGEDVWYKAVVPATGRLIVDMASSGGPTDMGMAWYTSSTNDCNNLDNLVECDDDDSQNGLMSMICRTGTLCTVPGDCGQNATLTPGDTVWIRVWEYGGGTFGPFDICAYEPDPPGPPSNCGSPTNIASLPYLASGLTTCCKNDDYTPTDGCASSYQDGEDYMFTYTPGANVTVDITISGTSTYTGVFVTDDCPNAGGVSCVGSNTNTSGNPSICGLNLSAGTTYYIMVDTDPGPTCTNFGITVRESSTPTCGLNYTASPIAYNPSPTVGTAISLPIDDRFSSVYVPIGFPFCYDGVQFTQLLVSSNGYVIFDPIGCATNLPTTNAAPGDYSGYSITSAIPNTTQAPRNAIMFPWQDTDPSLGGNIRYRTYGTAPNRYFVLSVNSMPMFSSSCTGYEFRGQLKLFETTNNIEMHMERKDKCTAWNGGKAILGLHNFNGTTAVCPAGYNYPAEWIANNEAWLFTCNCVGCIVLPIELMTFEGEKISPMENELTWSTASELNNHYFEIERKDEYSNDFIKIGEIDGAGFSNVVQNYEFIDDQVQAELSYYRLKQVDFDGEYSYTKTIVIGNQAQLTNSIYPNPATDVINININAAAEYVTVYIVNTLGEIVFEKQIDASNSIQEAIDVSEFASGNYQVLVRDDKTNVVMQEKLIIE